MVVVSRSLNEIINYHFAWTCFPPCCSLIFQTVALCIRILHALAAFSHLHCQIVDVHLERLVVRAEFVHFLLNTLDA